MSNASDGARIKIWPGVPPNTTGSDEGGGAGYVRNVTYELFYNTNNDCEPFSLSRVLTARVDVADIWYSRGYRTHSMLLRL